MNKEEIEELKEFTIDLTDIDELALGLEVCSKKSNMVIQEFIDTIVQLQQENQSLKKENKKLKDNWNYIKKMLKEARQEKYISGYCGTCTDIDIDFLLDKMQELQGSDSNVKD